jgi:hypothetical protein
VHAFVYRTPTSTGPEASEQPKFNGSVYNCEPVALVLSVAVTVKLYGLAGTVPVMLPVLGSCDRLAGKAPVVMLHV